MSARGFILQPTYRIVRERPVIHLYGILEDGAPCLIRDDRFRPRFYIRDKDGERANESGATNQSATPRCSIDGDKLRCVEVAQPAQTPGLRNRLLAAGIDCYEADLPFALLYLIEKGIKGSFQVDGQPERDKRLGWIWSNPEIAPARVAPELRVLSIDIETDPEASQLLSIALHDERNSEVLVLQSSPQAIPATATPFPTQSELLAAFAQRVRELDPDVLTGWNVIDFDLSVLDQIARRVGIPLHLGRDFGPLRMRSSRTPWRSNEAVIPGRQVLDGIDLLRSSFIRMEEYSLDFVAQQVLGERKTLHTAGRPSEILRQYRQDLERFVEYNLTDARLALEILKKLDLFSLAVERSLLTGLPVNRVGASIASFDFLYLTQLHQQQRIAHSVKRVVALPPASNEGGHVLEPAPGLYENVLVFDFKSLYPSIIRTFQIDPMGRISGETTEPWIQAPNGARFHRTQGILPRLLGELFPRREAAKQRGDEAASHAIKILMNSFYGVLGTNACRFYHPQLAGAITSFGKTLLLWCKSLLEEWDLEVLYGDTDSLFVSSTEPDPPRVARRGQELVARLNQALDQYIQEKWKVQSHLELEFERVYQKLHFPAVRHGSAGARKRYAGLIEEAGRQKIRFVGMEVVRRDWTELAKQVQRELYHRLFHELPLEDYLHNLVTELKAGKLDDWLIYRKGLRKNLANYTATTPPHVAAARKLPSPPSFGTVSYLMTVAGPEPLQHLQSPIDYRHYVLRQVRPVAVPILELLRLDFSELIGESYQLRLFER